MSEEATEPTANWKESLPAPLQDAPYFKNAETIDQVLADINGAAQWQGNSLRFPGPDATPEQVSEMVTRAQEKIPGLMAVPDPDSEDYGAIFQKLGTPKEAEKYKLPDGIEMDGDALGALKTQALEMNMTQKQFQAWVGKQHGDVVAQVDAQTNYWKEQDALIEGEWGAARATRMEAIANYLAQDESAPAELKQAFADGKVSVEYARWMHGIVDSMGEAAPIAGQQSDSTNITPVEAMERFQELSERLMKPGAQSDPNYQALVQKRVDMMRLAQVGR